jgi:hypothetical protein
MLLDDPIAPQLAWAFGAISSGFGAIICGALWLAYKYSLPKNQPG